MIPALRAEARKLLTVRSTYVILAAVALLALFFAGYAEGFRAKPDTLRDAHYLAKEVSSALSATAVFCGLVAVFLFAHEYRYNTIMYTLTSARSRGKILLAKVLVMTGFAAVFALVMGVLSPLAAAVGVHLAGHDLAAQTLPLATLAWHGLFYVWGYAMVGLLVVALTRNQIFAIVALFVLPATIEGLLELLLKSNTIYLPFTALNAVVESNPHITPEKAALVFLAWLVAWWIPAWALFLRRDAN